MNKKGFFKAWTFVIIVIALGLVIILGGYLMRGLNDSIEKTTNIEMINQIKTTVNSMLNENSGSTERILIRPPQKITKICFVDYRTQPSSPELRIANIVDQVYNSRDELENPENLFLLTEDDFEMHYIGKIQVEPTDGVYCIDSKNKINVDFVSRGKTILIKESELIPKEEGGSPPKEEGGSPPELDE